MRFRRRPTAKGVGLRVADSHTGNHPKDDFMPLETIQRLCSVFGRRSHLGFEKETSELKGRLDEFLSFYPIPSEYHVILPTSTQTILDAPPGYIGLYTHCFSLANLRLPLNDLFCEVLQYFNVHISRLNPFGCSKLMTFIVMCKAYDYEPFVELFRGFFNLCKADTIVPSKFPQLLLKENMLDIKSFKDKFPYGIEQNPQFQRLSRYPVSAHAFDDPILFLAGLQSSWENGQQRPTIFVGGKEMSFRNFIYTEEDEDLTFLPKDLSPGFNTRSPSVSINTEPIRTDEEPATDVAARIKERKCKTRGGSSRPPVKRKLASGLSTSRTVRAKASALKDDSPVLSISDDDEGLEDCLELKDATACHLKISAITPPTWKGFLDNHLEVDMLDLHDRCYARQAVMDNAVNRRSHELLEAKCEAAMTDFDKNPAVLFLREKMSSLAAEAKEHKGNLGRLMLESQKWSGYQEIEKVKHDRREVVSKVVPYACIELLHSDELGRLVGKLVSSAITFDRCRAYEQVARIKEPFDLLKVKGYRPSYEKEHTKDNNDLATATFSWLNKYVADASASVEALLSKKPPTLQKPVPSRTQMLVPSSQLATPSSIPSSKPMSPPADIVKPSPSPNE
ncbi:hypothetical protein Tco_1237537 [Tanacetum coccineum]